MSFLRQIPILAVGAFCVSTVSPANANLAAPPRNQSLLLIVTDTMRFDAGRIGTAGADEAVPLSLKRRGRHFVNALAAGNWTAPSMTALLTGHYASEFGLVRSTAEILRPSGLTLAERLRKAGYATAAVVSNPTLRALKLAEGFDHFDDRMTGKEPNRDSGTRQGAETTDAALQQLEALSRENKPWFLWVHYLEPHGPYLPPDRFVTLPGDPGPQLPLSSEDYSPKGTLPRYQFVPSCRGKNDYIARYRASARYSLSEADRLLNHGYSSGKLRDAVVVFTSDHGEFLGEQDYWFQHGMRIDPALVHVPLVISKSAEDPLVYDRHSVGNIDLVATLMPLLLGTRVGDTRGKDLYAPSAERPQALTTEFLELPKSLEIGVVMDGTLIVRSNKEPPAAFRRLAVGWACSRPDNAAVLEASRILRPAINRIWQTPAVSRSFTAEEIRVLRSLGYIAAN